MAVLIGSARIDENGKISGGSAGDSTKKEVCTQNWYLHSKKWRVLRPIDPTAGILIAKAMFAACENNKIGYDQGQRNTLYNQAKNIGFDMEKITTKCETDCSALVRVCCNYAGIKVGDFTTSNEASVLLATKQFVELTGKEYTQSSSKLRMGDILVTKTKGHTVVILSDGALAYENAELGKRVLKLAVPTMKGEDVSTLQKMLISRSFSCGKWGADGEFGSDTQSAVIAWQLSVGLPETGIMDDDDYVILLGIDDDKTEDMFDDETDDTSDIKEQYVKITNGSTVNVRTSPNTSGKILGLAYLGEAFIYLGEDSVDGWHYIDFGDNEGWISGKYTTIIDELPPIQTTPPVIPPSNYKDAVIVDISEHQSLKNSKNDWAKIAKNVDLLVLRCGVTRTATKPIGSGIDNEFVYAAKKCKEFGIPFGVYYYGKVKTEADARKEADKAFDTANPYNPLFYVYDVEEGRLTNASIKAWADQIRKRGAKKVGMYIAHNYYPTYKSTVKSFDFIWIPRYGKNDGTYNSKYKPSYDCDIHQYTSVYNGQKLGFYDNTIDMNRLTGTKSLDWFLEKL